MIDYYIEKSKKYLAD